MTEHADGPATDKAAWAGGDVDDVAAAQEVDEIVEGEIVNDGTAADDGVEAPVDGDGLADRAGGLQSQLDERTVDLQRVSAEFANYRRRVERDRLATIEAAKGAVLAELLPIVDDIDRARAHGDLDGGPLKAFADKIHAVLSTQGVVEFGAEGDPFDPAVHEAVQDESEGAEPVLGAVLRKGYRLGERTLRTAMVVVR